ncbi:Fe-S cluster assembly protein SufD [Lysobacter sp. SG-8]|uniref:Fe-S cluster assembly protein SufD n=1 Tax=Marilutibacter penaei TaxID=2759900 RepID=A0A7W3U391_9GAMM|nr:Fe-S cluster assembly protein SufD [Lysobacter penaei]MBB1088104.1 Fe-S cluster assembly protein SufD [Lysobacter penaei]
MTALLDSFREAFDALPDRDAAGLGESRRTALEAALGDGLPHARVEAWKYTSLRALERRSFVASTPVPDLDPAIVAGIPAPRLVFVNGRLAPALGAPEDLPEGVSLQPLSGVLSDGEARDANFLARRFDRLDEPFARINAALAVEGAVLRVAAGVQVQAPVHLVFVGAPADADAAWHLRHLVELGRDASLGVVEHHVSTGRHRHLSNHLLHAHLGPGTRLLHARVQDESEGATLMHRTDAALASDAHYRRVDLELGAALSRHELNIALHGDRSRADANGVLLASGKRHLETRLGLDHVGRDTACHLTWRGLAAGRSRAAFHGGILIREGADGTEAVLSNKNLLLDERAEIDSQPVLEIHADEVQAAHGATVGQIDQTALFYLRSRGIPAEQARALLTAAFCRETLSPIDDPDLRDMLAARLDAALARLEAE